MHQLQYDDFEQLEPIGAGTVGSIFKVLERATGDFYALKLLSPGISQNKLIADRFEREILVLSKLNHPNIVSYYGQGEHNGQLFFVMELLEGGTIKSLLESTGPFSWHETADCGRQICSALQHLHNHGIIHRDIKPGNVFLSGDAKPKLGDFGIAQDQHSAGLTDAGLTVGTYAYMCPELVRGETAITGKVDLYALGCLFFEMITGRTPFVGDGFVQLFEQHLNSPPPRLRDFAPATPEGFDKLVQSLLAKDPESRPFNARAVQGRLGALLEPLEATSAATDASNNDAGAGQVHWGQQAIQRRLSLQPVNRDVSWTKLGLIAALLAGVLGLFFLFGSAQ